MPPHPDSTHPDSTRLDWVDHLLDAALANWNQHPDYDTKDAMRRVWHTVLKDLDPTDARNAFRTLVVANGRFPRPVEIRKLVIDATHPDPLPTPMQAWSAWVERRQRIHSGLEPRDDLHPLVRATVDRLGSTASGLHTNGDRELFLDTYRNIVATHEQTRYALS